MTTQNGKPIDHTTVVETDGRQSSVWLVRDELNWLAERLPETTLQPGNVRVSIVVERVE